MRSLLPRLRADHRAFSVPYSQARTPSRSRGHGVLEHGPANEVLVKLDAVSSPLSLTSRLTAASS
jgi:hypothetical protein